MGRRILVIDDDALMRRTLAYNLSQAGYTVSTAATAEAGLEVAGHETPDLALLDIGLPGMDGLDALRHFKKSFDFPVIFLTARRRELDEILGLELGADDYITKPYDMDVLLAHLKAVLRRSEYPARPPSEPVQITVGDLAIDPLAHTVCLADKEVELTPREFDLLYALALEPRRVFSIDELLTRVWGVEYTGQPQVVYVQMRFLREKIEENPNEPQRLLTVRGIGYKLEPKGEIV
jgi:DNA-binding response OmpR family regulator